MLRSEMLLQDIITTQPKSFLFQAMNSQPKHGAT
jgi:hypothetical protein